MNDITELVRRLDDYEWRYGGLRAACKALSLDPSYWSKIKRGLKQPSDAFLYAVDMERVVTYRRLNP